MSRWRKRIKVGAAAGLAALAALVALDLLFPPDLARYEDRSVEVRAADGRVLRAFLTSDDKWRLTTAAGDVDPEYLAFLKAYEDQRFDWHPGVDPMAAARAALQLVGAGEVVSGASTLSMQAARLLEPGPRGVGAKVKQMVRALQLERRYSKDEILGIYLTLAPFGGNIEGVRAASLAYFGKEPKTLTTAQAALLVAIPQSPERLRPDRQGSGARAGRDKVLTRLIAKGLITAAAAETAREADVPATRLAMPFLAPQFADTLRAARDPASGPVLRSTIEPELQRSLEALAQAESHWFLDGATMALIVVDNETRSAIGYLGGLDFWGPAGQFDMARAIRSPGSTLKPFIYASAFDELPLHPETILNDEPIVFGDYAPQNFDHEFQGMVSVRDALQMSLNVPAVAVLDRLGPVRFASLLERGGADIAFRTAGETAGLPLALGGVGISLYDLTELYGALAGGGIARPIRTLSDAPAGPETRLFTQRAAWYVGDILAGSPLPDSFARGRGVVRPRTIAFKTGTSYGYRDAWSVGYSARYTVGVWVGRPDGSARAGLYGRNVAAPLLLKVFDLLPAESDAPWPRPSDALIVADRRELPRAMHYFEAKPAMAAETRKASSPPQISFPPDGALLALGPKPEERTIELRVSGGAHPIRWVVNGEVLPETDFLTAPTWVAPGPGFVRIVAVDAYGRSASSQIRIRLERP